MVVTDMYEYLQVGKIVNTHGVRGEVKLIPLTDDLERFGKLKWAYVESDGSMKKYDIENVRYFKGTVILKLQGVDTAEAAEAIKDRYLLVDRANAVKLPENTYFICDLIGCEVYDETGNLLGKLYDVLKTGSNDVYAVKNEAGKEILIPALKSVVTGVSPENMRIDVVLPKGLLEDEV